MFEHAHPNDSFEAEQSGAPCTQVLQMSFLQAQRYALILAEQREMLPADLPFVPLVPKQLAKDVGLMPLALDLWALDEKVRLAMFEQLIELQDQKEASPIAALLIADCDIKQLSKHLSDIQFRRYLQQSGWLRLVDPRVWIQLPRVLGAREVARLFGPVQQWSVCLYGDWVVTRPLSPAMLETVETPPLALRWPALLRMGIVNRALAHLGWLSYPQAQAQSELLDALVYQGQSKHQLSRSEELIAYACLGIHCGLAFDEHPIALAAIAGLDRDEPDASIVDALNEIPKEQWEIIQKETHSKMYATQLPLKANNGR
ncbi:hypothetical protein [Iodobacter fluviatilis]|uniref:DUF4123 domain-containing protein n=1 Tax=Iodobacter fluviatilis TaxID=537 RepID=A0A377Q8I7_9NEIS|nr:hypothetical protein [Iodobacter fluviatilis]TCU81881.1 hypothetical protein EV682_1182 [Iodobacter fluviatilis]STQ91586.1 Uncharacterised protein [Iodobacter fluviatilis]